MQILFASSLSNAKKLIESDPFIIHKYYMNYRIFELNEANENNHYLMEDTQTMLNMQEIHCKEQ